MARSFRSRVDDSTFDLNLAPMLDIIVSIVPMLLLSVVFVEIMMIETPLPQPVSELVEKQREEKTVTFNLIISKKEGYRFVIDDKGKKVEFAVPLKGKDLDGDALNARAYEIKKLYPQYFRLELKPDPDVKLNEIVKTMDELRKIRRSQAKLTFVDPKTQKNLATDLMFPEVTFADIVGQSDN